MSKLTEVLASHRLVIELHNGWWCLEACGASYRTTGTSYADHLADAIAAAGLAVVELPEPILGPDADGHVEFSDGSEAGTVQTDLGSGVVWHGTWEWTVDEARDVAAQWLAAALLAAANAAEAHA